MSSTVTPYSAAMAHSVSPLSTVWVMVSAAGVAVAVLVCPGVCVGPGVSLGAVGPAVAVSAPEGMLSTCPIRSEFGSLSSFAATRASTVVPNCRAIDQSDSPFSTVWVSGRGVSVGIGVGEGVRLGARVAVDEGRAVAVCVGNGLGVRVGEGIAVWLGEGLGVLVPVVAVGGRVVELCVGEGRGVLVLRAVADGRVVGVNVGEGWGVHVGGSVFVGRTMRATDSDALPGRDSKVGCGVRVGLGLGGGSLSAPPKSRVTVT